MDSQKRVDQAILGVNNNINNNNNGNNEDNAPDCGQQEQQEHQREETAGTEGDGNGAAEPLTDLLTFYQVDLKEVTNALLVPAHMLSAKLQPRSSLTNTEGEVVQTTPTSNGEDNFETGSSNSSSVADATPVGRPRRYRPHHSTLKAAVLTSLDNTYYVEETLVIGSMSRRGGLLERGGDAGGTLSEQRQATSPSCRSNLITSPLKQSVVVPAVQSPVARHQSEVPGTPSSRGVTFLVQRPSKIEFGVDNAMPGNGGDSDCPLLEGSSSSKKPKKKKSVRFPENVIKSVSVVEADDQLHLLVEYNHPWYAHLVLVVASAFFVLHWALIAQVTKPSLAEERIAAASVVSFVAFGLGSTYLLAFLALMWRPGSEEREYLKDFSRNRPVIYVLLAGVVAQLSLVATFMLSVNSVGLVCFCCIPLVLTYLYEEYKKHSVSALDAMGCILVLGSIVLFSVGAETDDAQEMYHRVVPVITALVGGASMAFFLFQVRTVSRYVSNFLVMSSTIVLSTLVLAFVAYITRGFTTPIGTSHCLLTEISSADFLKIALSALFLFLSWFVYHWSSLFFDRMTLSGSFSIGGPISLLVFFLLSLPTASLPYGIAGGVAMTIGCGLVLFSGYRFRQNLEVRIELECE